MEKIFTIKILFITVLPIWIIFRAANLIKNKRINKKEEILKNLFVIYLIFLVGITIFPITIKIGDNGLSTLKLYERANINLIPFISYFKYKVSTIGLFRNLFGNLVLLMPLVIFKCISSKKFRNLKSCIILCLSASMTIECIQLILNLLNMSSRTVNIDDLILNTLGGVIGYYICNYALRKDKLNKNI